MPLVGIVAPVSVPTKASLLKEIIMPKAKGSKKGKKKGMKKKGYK